jgi:predicted lipoprotein with Yx(FWY)xxD motif
MVARVRSPEVGIEEDVMRTRTIAGAAVMVAVLAACGSSGSKKSSGTNSTTSTTAGSSSTSQTSGPSSTPIVKTASNPRLGTIVVDANGATLYTLTNGGQAAPCTGGCLNAWPPLLLPAGVTTATGTGVTGLGTVSAGGGTQVTHGGLPLYRFVQDAAAGDANGEGISSFGGVWHVVKTSGASAGGTTSSSSGRSGYGY